MYDLLNLLDNILGQHQRHAHGEYYWSCPFCHHYKPKLAINVNKGAWHCWVCGASGKKLLSLFRKLDCSKEQIEELRLILNDDISYVTVDVESLTTIKLSLPMEYKPLSIPSNLISYRHALSYVTNRGITASDILRYQIGYCSEGLYTNRIIIPSYDSDGKLNYFVGRSFYNNADGAKYKNPPVSKNIVCFDFHINWSEPIVLCEGVYDAIAIKRNAIPLLGKTISSKLLEKITINNVKTIYLSLDPDALKQTSKIAEQFIKDGREVRIIKLQNSDPSELGFSSMIDLMRTATPLGFAELVKLRATS